MQITILGAGMIGSAIAKDLAQEAGFRVTAVDLNEQALAKLEAGTPVKGIRADLQEEGSVSSVVADCDLVICAVPGFMGFETLKSIIEAGKNVVDISFFGEDAFLLDELAKSKGVTAVVDCGVAPGLCNIIAGYAYGLLDQTDSYVCYVGGLPQVRQWPFEYKAVFSPCDVLEEYTRPARFTEYGKEVVRSALSDGELITFPELGTLEAFNTDGLRTLRRTLDIPFMREKTLRYPGHANLVLVFRESGFFNTNPIEVEGQMVRPIALTSKLLFDQWRLNEREADLTVMQVVIEGQKQGRRFRHNYYLLDKYDEETQTTSMARTTGYTCAIVARQVINGLLTRKGICAPEFIGRTKGCYENLLGEYAKRNIRLTETITEQAGGA
ncbi:MAG: saccharopine dehydrogenase NADP-binding domain-containing protein [Deltaproteobacteria bacterium]|nr:MAG: saccharopine dehydrogenase NADP-binding domain-containing protein [Deltaproteobacteria bacterium]